MTDTFQNERVLTPTGLGFDLWTRPALVDETVIEEVIKRNSYRLTGTLNDAVVLDCGAHVGVFSTLCAHLGARRVVAVEPQPENLELLRLNVEPFEQVVVVPAAIGATVGIAHMRGESGGAHLVNRSSDHELDCVEVAQISLSSLIDGDPIAVLKMDMEGGEVDALLACPHEMLAHVARIVLETHGPAICPWVERPRVGEVVEHLLYTHNVEAAGFPDYLGLLFADRNSDRVRFS